MSVCFSWAQRLSSAAADRRAQKQARAALQDLRRGYEKLIQLDLPKGATRAIVGVCKCIADLEPLVPEVAAPAPRPWLRALPDEQAQWAAKAAGGGTLLRKQVCKAAEGGSPTDWHLGTLGISDTGLLFKSYDVPGETQLSVGLVQWSQITALAKGAADKDLTVTWDATGKNQDLQLKLSIPQDAEWLEELWAANGRDDVITTLDKLDLRNLSRTSLAKKEDARSEHTSSSEETDFFDTDLPLGRPSFSHVLSVQEPLRQRLLSTQSNFESPWYMACPDGVPNMDVPENVEPLCVHQLPDATLESVAAALEADDWPFPSFLSQFHGASEFEKCKWASSSRVEGTAVRVLQFTMPLPQELPRAVQMLINLPKSTRITNTYRLRKSSDEITLIVQVSSPGVPFGENFRIQELNSFRKLPGGGVEVRKWIEVIWVVALPWGLSPVKAFAEKKIMDDYCKGAGPLASFLNEAAARKLQEGAGDVPRCGGVTESRCTCGGSIITL